MNTPANANFTPPSQDQFQILHAEPRAYAKTTALGNFPQYHHFRGPQMAERHNPIREGIYAGLIGATAIAVWFAIIDIVSGMPLHTPSILGAGLISVLGKPPMMPDTVLFHAFIYTIFHYVAFAIVGIILTAIVHQSARTPAVLAGLLVAFVAFQLGAIGLTALFTESRLGGMAWYQIFLANLVATLAMGWFMWKRHPALRSDIDRALAGTDDFEVPEAEVNRDSSPGQTR
jgi:hypothetical protein